MIRKLGVANLVLLSIPLAFAVVNVPTSGIAQTVFSGPFSSLQVQAGGTAELNPNYAAFAGPGTSGSNSTAVAMSGFGVRWQFTPKIGGNVKIFVSDNVNNSYGAASGQYTVTQFYYGDTAAGPAPAPNAAVPSGAVAVGPTIANFSAAAGATSYAGWFVIVTGLTVGHTYWFDIGASTTNSINEFYIFNPLAVIEEIFG